MYNMYASLKTNPQTRTLLVAPGLTTSNKKLLVTKGITTRSKDNTRGAPCSLKPHEASETQLRPTGHRALIPAGYPGGDPAAPGAPGESGLGADGLGGEDVETSQMWRAGVFFVSFPLCLVTS